MTHKGYYTKGKRKECIIEMIETYGTEYTVAFCLLNCHKYMYRAGLKTKSCVTDMEKAQWYMEYAKDLIEKERNPVRRYRMRFQYIKATRQAKI